MKTQNILMSLIIIGFTAQSYGQISVCERIAVTSTNTSQFQEEWNTAQITLFNKMYACNLPKDAYSEMLQDKWIAACEAQEEKRSFDRATKVLLDLSKVIHAACVKHMPE